MPATFLFVAQGVLRSNNTRPWDPGDMLIDEFQQDVKGMDNYKTTLELLLNNE